MKNLRTYVLTPVLLFFVLLLDGQLSAFLSSFLPFPWRAACHLLFVFMLFLSINLSRNYTLLLFLGLGFLYDLYYLHMIGVAVLLFPSLSLLVSRMNASMMLNRFTRFLSAVTLLFLFELLSFLLASLFGLAGADFGHFVICSLIPTLICNCLLLFIIQPVFENVYL